MHLMQPQMLKEEQKRFEGLTDDSAAVMKLNAENHKINQNQG